MDSGRSCWSQCAIFLRENRIALALMIPAALAYTLVHEGAHAAAVLVQGGRVVAFEWLPRAGQWGSIRYAVAPGRSISVGLIAIAPYLLAVLLCLAAAVVGLRRRRSGRMGAALVFFGLFVLPLGDLAHHALPYLLHGTRGDLHRAFGAPDTGLSVAIAAGGIAAAVLGYYLQHHLFRTCDMGPRAYLLLGMVAALLTCIIEPY